MGRKKSKMIIALYLRLSESDGDLGVDGKDESNSIENQRLLLRDYVEEREDLEGDVQEYVDDGYSGTNFDRPAFKCMLEDAKKGNIQVIVVKDLSRLGRDYITAGDYIEQIFPMLNVRFIAANNGYDSSKFTGGTMGFDMAVSNMINTFYSRDLSKKMKAANQTRWKKGISTSGSAPFGYVIHRGKKREWRIDPDAAAIVRMIFEKALDGLNTTEIAAYLNEKNMPTPWVYNQTHHNWKLAELRTKMEERLWDTSKVWSVLKKYEYTGAMVMGRRKSIFVGGKGVTQPKDEWTVVEEVHEAIVTHEEFEQANQVIRERKNPKYIMVNRYPLKSKVFCGNCRRRLAYEATTYKEIVCCRHGRQVGKYSECDKEEYSVKHLEEIVLRSIQEMIGTLESLGVQAGKIAADNRAKNKGYQKTIALEMEQLKAEKIRLYERYADQLITKEIYLQKKQEVSDRLMQLEKLEKQKTEVVREQNEIIETADSLTNLARRFQSEKTLSGQMVQAFIDGVYVYHKDQIEIKFLFEDEFQKLVQCIEEYAETK
jgi:DNA invertase Pin-like site-specific DNA recombinase